MSITVKDLIKEKDYNYISWRRTIPEHMGGGDFFAGATKSVNGELISLDGDIYSVDEEVLEYEEWQDKKNGIENGLTIIVKGNWG